MDYCGTNYNILNLLDEFKLNANITRANFNMNILYINHYAGSIYHGMEYRPYYLAREWVRLGHNVTIIASNISHIRTQNIVIPEGQKYLEENVDGIKYIWCKTPAYNGNGMGRVINIFMFLRRLKQLIPQLICHSKPDLVIASSTYPFDTRIAAKIALLTQAKFVYEVHDLWPLTLIELNGISKYHPYIWWMQRAEDFGYKNADKVVSLLPKALDYMREHGLSADRFAYIPNGVSVADWSSSYVQVPSEHIERITQIKSKYSFVIGYAGSMGEANALDFLLSAAKGIPQFGFILIGDGPKKSELLDRLNKENITNVFFLPRLNKAQIPDFLARMDALYIGWNNLPIYRFGISPNKLFDYMLSSKPIIHSVTAGNDLVAAANCGISIAAENIEQITTAINRLANMPVNEREVLGQNGYNYVIKHHDFPILAKRFLVECGVDDA